MLRMNLRAAATPTLLLTALLLLLPEPVLAIGGPAPPDIYLTVTPKALPVASGCPATFNVRIVSQEGFRGAVNLMVLTSPSGVNAIFEPNPVNVGEYSEARSILIVTVSPDTPLGVTSLSVKATSNDQRLSHTATITLNIEPPCTQQQSENNTTTNISSTSSNVITTAITEVTLTQTVTSVQISTSTATVSTIFTSFTATSSLEQSTGRLTSIWAIGATITALALAEVLLLRRAK